MRGRGRGRGGGRGRGRSASGGRGRSAGRVGRGGRRGGARSAPPTGTDSDANDIAETQPHELDVDKNVKNFFVGNVTIEQHYKGQEQNRDRYAACMAVLEASGVEIAQNARVRGLAAAWARHDHDFAWALLKNRKSFGMVEVLKALNLLDAGRQIRVLEKKLKRLQLSSGKVLPHTLGKLKSSIDNLNAIKPPFGSASGAVCKHVRSWVRTLSKEELEFYALHFPTGGWKKLADICHINPKKDFPNLEWFLPFCYGESAPEDHMVSRCRTLTQENINGLIKEFPIPYAHAKDYKAHLTDESKACIASYEKKLDTILWYYEDLTCEAADKVIMERIRKGEEIMLPSGKFLDRLLLMKIRRENIAEGYRSHSGEVKDILTNRPVDESKAPFYKDLLPMAQKRISEISLTLESPVVIMGDASGSMEVAIKTSTIIAGILTTITSAELVFFNTETRNALFLPKTVEEVLQLAVDTKAGGGTAPAASLYPYFKDKKIIKTFIVVTDEQENQTIKHQEMGENGNIKTYNFNFCQLYKRYHEEVYPAKLVFVSFLINQHVEGTMVRPLKDEGFNPIQFKFEGHRPDLTKLDKLFGLLSAEHTSSFEEELKQMEVEIKLKGLAQKFEEIANLRKD
ncbi:hypothetical protein CHS0354_011259 [Potamilus streckersoni]|uniref:Uncharacterized protein n=1 Tax=Potamilus streckersoni TaxID=2493646 RepID=A0AAE0VF97_9BIVA|nr:hypothetical protein CHS0354_011259 [Potamilus streckersoni]